jgi:orotidine-5'-phosphate decarboxylase
MPETKPNERLIVALDRGTLDGCLKLVEELADLQLTYKIGLRGLTRFGFDGLEKLKKAGGALFLDYKMHDIPNTVAGGIEGAAMLFPRFITIHAAGGREMLTAAAEAARRAGGESEARPEGWGRPLLLGVTVLTSLDAASLKEVGFAGEPREMVLQLASLCAECGIDGIVCSGEEVADIKNELGDKVFAVVPGIRPSGADAGDQKRILTPKEAIARGADFIVVGRPIYAAENLRGAAEGILAEIAAAG